MEWLVEGNEIGSVRSRDLVSLLQHIIVADSHAFPPKCLLEVLIHGFGIIWRNTLSRSSYQHGSNQDHFLEKCVSPQMEFDYKGLEIKRITSAATMRFKS